MVKGRNTRHHYKLDSDSRSDKNERRMYDVVFDNEKLETDLMLKSRTELRIKS